MQDSKNNKKTEGVQARFFTWEHDVPVKQVDEQQVAEPAELPAEKAMVNISNEATYSTVVEENISRENAATDSVNDDSIISREIESVSVSDTNDHSLNGTKAVEESEVLTESFDSAEQAEFSDEASTKRYTKASDFSRLAMVFRDRKLQYYLYIVLFFAASVSAATLMFKFEKSGIITANQIALDYMTYGETLKSDLLGSMLFASPFILGSLFVYFGGYTIFAKFLSSIWMVGTGFFWSLFSVSAYPKFSGNKFIIFGFLSALLILNNIILAAEAGKYSALNLYGKNELTKFENVRQFSIVYIGYCIFTCAISYFVLRFVV